VISKQNIKQADELIQLAKNIKSTWTVEIVDVSEKERILDEAKNDNDPNNYRVVIFT